MKLTIIYDDEKDRYYVKDNDQFLGWFWTSEYAESDLFHYVHSNPIAISGDQLIAIGHELNKLNQKVENDSDTVHLRCL